MNTTDRKNFHRRYKLHLATAYDPERPAVSFVRFHGRYAYAGDGRVFVRADIRQISTFSEDEVNMLDGKAISAAAYRQLLDYDIATVTAKGFEVTDNFGNRIIFRFNEQQELSLNFRDMFEPLTDNHRIDADNVGISAARLSRIGKIIGATNLRIELYHHDYCLVTDPQLDDEADVRCIMQQVFVPLRQPKEIIAQLS